MILGVRYSELPRVYEGRSKSYCESSHKFKLPIFACSETHDTKRTAARDGGIVLNKVLTIQHVYAKQRHIYKFRARSQ